MTIQAATIPVLALRAAVLLIALPLLQGINQMFTAVYQALDPINPANKNRLIASYTEEECWYLNLTNPNLRESKVSIQETVGKDGTKIDVERSCRRFYPRYLLHKLSNVLCLGWTLSEDFWSSSTKC